MDVLVVEPCLNQNAMFKKLMKVLRNSRLLEHNRCSHIKAKVPILKFRLSQSQVDVDLSVNIYDGVRNSQAIRKNLMLFPQLRPLIITLKCFLAQQHMNETATGGVGSYLLYAMCLQLMPGTTLGSTHSEAHGASDLDGPVLNGHGFNQLEAERDGFGGVTPPNLSRLTVPPSSHKDGVDLGKLLLQFLRVYGAQKKSLCILDPMKPESNLGAKARKFPSLVAPELLRRYKEVKRRRCLSALIHGWPQNKYLQNRDEIGNLLGIQRAMLHGSSNSTQPEVMPRTRSIAECDEQ